MRFAVFRQEKCESFSCLLAIIAIDYAKSEGRKALGKFLPQSPGSCAWGIVFVKQGDACLII